MWEISAMVNLIEGIVVVSMSIVMGTLPVLANDIVSIAAIRTDREAYRLREVVLKGTLREINNIPPYAGRYGLGMFGLVRDSCKLLLQDETGTIEVQVLQNCAITDLQALALRNDIVEIHGQVQISCTSECPLIVIIASQIRHDVK